MVSKVLLLLAVFCIAVVRGVSSEAKICYQCDELHPSSKWKFWGEKITKCSGVPFDKYATKTSKAFGGAVLTCYTKFNEKGEVIKRAAYGLGEVYDKTVKCRDRYHLCCRSGFCNRHTISPCPPPPKVEPKNEVKACYECKGVEACRPENLQQHEIRTSAVLGASNLYCFTKFDPKTGNAIARGGFGFGEIFDKHLKCDAKHYLCCYENLCNKQTAGYCAKPNYGQNNQNQPNQNQDNQNQGNQNQYNQNQDNQNQDNQNQYNQNQYNPNQYNQNQENQNQENQNQYNPNQYNQNQENQNQYNQNQYNPNQYNQQHQDNQQHPDHQHPDHQQHQDHQQQ